MTYLARGYMSRSYLDSSLGGASTGGGAPPVGSDLVGSDTVTFTESGTLGTSLRATDTLTFTDTGNLKGASLLAADMTNPQAKVTFSLQGRLSVIVPPVTPPDGTVYIKRVSHTMPAPNLDANGRPQ